MNPDQNWELLLLLQIRTPLRDSDIEVQAREFIFFLRLCFELFWKAQQMGDIDMILRTLGAARASKGMYSD